jgi:hypothetical protein
MSSERPSEPRLRGEDKPRDLGLLAPVAAGCDSGSNPGPSTTFLLADALHWLGKGYREKEAWMPWLKVLVEWDSLRSEPRFADLLKRLKLDG